MADISIVINPAETISANILPPNSISIGTADSYPPHASSHAPGGYDSLSSYYVATGDLTGYVNKSQTGYLSGTFYPYSANPAGYVQGAVVRPSNTGNFVDKTSSQVISGEKNFKGVVLFDGEVYAQDVRANNLYGNLEEWFIFPCNGYLGQDEVVNATDYHGLTLNTDQIATSSRIDFSGAYPDTFWTRFVIPNSGASVNFSSSGPTLLMPNGSGFSGVGYVIEVRAVGNNKLLIQPISEPPSVAGSTGYLTGYVNKTETGNFYPRSNPSGYITSGQTGNFITTSQTGQFVSTGSTGSFVTGSVVRPSETGVFLTTGQTGVFITSSQTGQFVSTGSTGSFVTGSVVRPSETGVFITTGQTGSFITTSQTGVFYPNSNPSGYITGVDLSSYATTVYVTGVSGYLQGQITNLNNATGSYVTTGQTGQFYPTSNPSGFLTSGSSIDLIHLYAKNDQGTTIYKGQAVYIGGANGANPLIKLASNTGETTSSKTIGLLAQDLSVNQFGYIITEGVLEGFDTSAAAAGDPMWLGTGGNIIYGLANKPYGNNHLVYLGAVLRSNNNNGKVYVKPQNGFEIEELHRVYAKNASTNDTLMYNSGSGSWFARQITTGDVSGISSYALNANTGSFVTSNATGAFLTTGAADSRYYNISNGQSISGFATTGFNDAVTGMSVTGDTTKTITLFQRGGSSVSSSFTDNAGTGGGSGTVNVNDSNLIISISMFA